MNSRISSNDSGLTTCGCYLILFVFNISVGGWSVNYLLDFFLGKTIPFIGATLIGLFSAQISVPVAIIIAVLKHFGVL